MDSASRKSGHELPDELLEKTLEILCGGDDPGVWGETEYFITEKHYWVSPDSLHQRKWLRLADRAVASGMGPRGPISDWTQRSVQEGYAHLIMCMQQHFEILEERRWSHIRKLLWRNWKLYTRLYAFFPGAGRRAERNA